MPYKGPNAKVAISAGSSEKSIFINEGIIKGAALDVIDTEPMLKDCILCNAKNITITPHVAWAPIETRKRLVDIVADNLKAFLEGNPVNVVNR